MPLCLLLLRDKLLVIWRADIVATNTFSLGVRAQVDRGQATRTSSHKLLLSLLHGAGEKTCGLRAAHLLCRGLLHERLIVAVATLTSTHLGVQISPYVFSQSGLALINDLRQVQVWGLTGRVAANHHRRLRTITHFKALELLVMTRADACTKRRWLRLRLTERGGLVIVLA